MKPWTTLATAPAPDGHALILQQRDDEFVIRVAGQVLMSSRMHGSERAMAQLALDPAHPKPQPRVLLGGLGLGHTLRALLDALPPRAIVDLAELIPAVIEWNRGPLAHLARAPLSDPRVKVHAADVRKLLAPRAFDAILLDVDNGPTALTSAKNGALYSEAGVHALHEALTARGRLVVWSAGPDERFLKRLTQAGFRAEAKEVPALASGKGSRHVLFLGVRS
ncbi:MAG: hypothetical protein JST92_09615 [Deltaproteobacteria bacterium]|nr:hypothetical protein [Deltaproteobacteria bacterium]